MSHLWHHNVRSDCICCHVNHRCKRAGLTTNGTLESLLQEKERQTEEVRQKHKGVEAEVRAVRCSEKKHAMGIDSENTPIRKMVGPAVSKFVSLHS